MVINHLPETNGQKVNSPRPTIELVLQDGRVYTGKRGACLADLLRVLPEWDNPPIMGAVVNGELRELTYAIEMDARIRLITMGDDDGSRIYRRSITFLMEAAFEELFPKAQMTLDHSVSSGGYYCQVFGRDPLNAAELKRLLKRMHELVDADLPFARQLVPIDEAMEYFTKIGAPDKVQLLQYRQKGYLVLYQLGDHRDYHHGYMVPSTGYLKWFDLETMGEGFRTPIPAPVKPNEDLSHGQLSQALEHFSPIRQLAQTAGDRIRRGVK